MGNPIKGFPIITQSTPLELTRQGECGRLFSHQRPLAWQEGGNMGKGVYYI